MQKTNTRRGFTQNVGICPPCGESVAVATKEGQNWEKTLWPLLPRLTAVLPPQGREITTHGFTLIELLVVVLIIGILAAVALPQYQLAVDKSRLSKLLSMVQAVKKAQVAYDLENGTYTDNWNDLSLSFPGTISEASLTSDEGWELVLQKRPDESSGIANGVLATDSLLPGIHVHYFFRNSNVWNEHLACYALTSNTRANRLCKSATGKSNPDEDSGSGENKYNVYFFN